MTFIEIRVDLPYFHSTIIDHNFVASRYRLVVFVLLFTILLYPFVSMYSAALAVLLC